MPKSLSRSFSYEFLRGNGILALDPDALLQPAEAAVLLGTTTMSLERARKVPIEARRQLRWLTLMDYLAALRWGLETEPKAELAVKRQNAAASYGANLRSKDKVTPRT